jgi:hypothetical protein
MQAKQTPVADRSAGPGIFVVERVTRIELALSAWEADVLPLNYTRARPSVQLWLGNVFLTVGPSGHSTGALGWPDGGCAPGRRPAQPPGGRNHGLWGCPSNAPEYGSLGRAAERGGDGLAVSAGKQHVRVLVTTFRDDSTRYVGRDRRRAPVTARNR